MTIQVAHLSDTHVGFTQYPQRLPSGRGVREQDFVRAFHQAIVDIEAWDPHLVIHSGDFYDKPVVSLRHQKQGQDALQRLARRPDGATRPVIVISGNHDQPSDPREPCALELDSPIPGVHIVTSRYTVVDLAEEVAAGRAHPDLENVVVHCLPHDVLRTCEFDDVQPLPGRVNILTCHGVVGGSDLYKRTIGREYPLPIPVVTRGWDYVAMGHWHKRGPVAVGGYDEKTSPIWYAGSTENNGFADVHGCHGGDGRGYLRVTVESGKAPQVTGVDLPIRAMFRLPEIDGRGMTPDQLTDALVSGIAAAHVSGAVVSQTVSGVLRDIWNLVDLDRVRAAAEGAVWYETRPIFISSATSDEADTSEETDLNSIVSSVAHELLKDDPDRDSVLTHTTRLLGEALASSPAGDGSEAPPEEQTASAPQLRDEVSPAC